MAGLSGQGGVDEKVVRIVASMILQEWSSLRLTIRYHRLGAQEGIRLPDVTAILSLYRSSCIQYPGHNGIRMARGAVSNLIKCAQKHGIAFVPVDYLV